MELNYEKPQALYAIIHKKDSDGDFILLKVERQDPEKERWSLPGAVPILNEKPLPRLCVALGGYPRFYANPKDFELIKEDDQGTLLVATGGEFGKPFSNTENMWFTYDLFPINDFALLVDKDQPELGPFVLEAVEYLKGKQQK